MSRLLRGLFLAGLLGGAVLVAVPGAASASAVTATQPGCQADAACAALVDQVGVAAEHAFARATAHAILAAKTVQGVGFTGGSSAVTSYCDALPGTCGQATGGYADMPGKTGPNNNPTDVPGLLAGHYTDPNVLTGTTAFIMPGGATVGVEVRGSAPGSRETEVVRSDQVTQPINAVVLSGGSAYGLAAADGVAQWLEQNHLGLPLKGGVVPIVPSAIIFDPGRFGPFTVHPTAQFGFNAATAAKAGPLAEGSVGAGAGAESGGVKGGIGFASEDLGNGIIVAAAADVNSVGDVYDTGNACILYGARLQLAGEFKGVRPPPNGCTTASGSALAVNLHPAQPVRNTTVGIVATNLALDKAMANKLAQYGQDGMALGIRPSHTMLDGDTVFSISTGTVTGPAAVGPVGLPNTTAARGAGVALLAFCGAGMVLLLAPRLLAALARRRSPSSVPN